MIVSGGIGKNWNRRISVLQTDALPLCYRAKLCALLCFLLFCIVVTGTAPVYADLVDLRVISEIESSGRADAKGDYRNGRPLALGLYQLHQAVVVDYNRVHNTRYLHQDALDSTIAHKVADWYVRVEIPRLLKFYKLPVTTSNILAAYNVGIGNVRRGRIPQQYIAKYQKLAKEAV